MSKEHAYAYEAGYRDGSIHYELEHCPACKNVADLQEVLEENAKLRKELESVGTAAYLYGRSDLKAENDRLRELVRDMCVWAYIDSDCDLEDRFADRMRELGVEVDE